MSRDNSERNSSNGSNWGAERIGQVLQDVGFDSTNSQKSSSQKQAAYQSEAETLPETVVSSINQLDMDNDMQEISPTNLLQNITAKHNGTMLVIDLADTPAEIDHNTLSNTRYFLTEPVFLGQLPFTKHLNLDTLKQLAFLLNKMLLIHTKRDEQFVIFPGNDEAVNMTSNASALIAIFLFKYDHALHSLNGEKMTPTQFLLELYDRHFLFKYFENGKVAIIHFDEKHNRENAKTEISTHGKKVTYKTRGLPSNAFVIEKVVSNKEPTKTNNSQDQKKVSKLFFTLDGRRYIPVEETGTKLNFSQSYTLQEITSYNFILSKNYPLPKSQSVNSSQLFRANAPLHAPAPAPAPAAIDFFEERRPFHPYHANPPQAQVTPMGLFRANGALGANRPPIHIPLARVNYPQGTLQLNRGGIPTNYQPPIPPRR